MRKILLLQIIAVTVALSVGACKSNPKQKPPKESDESGATVNFQVIISPDVNPDITGRPSPIRLDIYQLSADGDFRQANYSDLVNKPKDVLGDKLIQQNQYMFHPDTVQVIPMKLDSNLKYLGVVASYYNLNNSEWKLVLLKQDRRWYQIRKRNYLYLNLSNNAAKQLSKEEMKAMLKDYEQRHPDSKAVKGNKARKTPNNWEKGIFREDTQ